jgi:predicted peroxiredoxin
MLQAAIFIVLALGVAGTQASGHGGGPKGLFVVVTSPDAQTQMMAMVLSTQAMKQGKSVRVLLCGPAGALAVKGSPETMLKPPNKSPQMLLRNLIKNGVTVEICPLYVPNAEGVSAEDLIDGVATAKPPMIAEGLLAKGVKLFTF